MLAQIIHHFKLYGEGRSLFVTEKGYIGFGTCGIDIGNMFIVIHGCGVSLILKEKEDSEKWERLVRTHLFMV